MSYILEALRKSEKNRKREEIRLWLKLTCGIALFVFAAGSLSYYVFGRKTGANKPAETVVTVVSQPATPVKGGVSGEKGAREERHRSGTTIKINPLEIIR